jgi:hypothetical protein
MENLYLHNISVSDLEIKLPVIYRALGYGKTYPPEYIIELVEAMLSEISNLVDIKGGYKIINNCSYIDKQKMLFGDIEFKTEKIITSQLKESEGVVIFVCTLGSKYDDWCRQFKEDDEMLQIFAADVLGSELVESATDILESIIRNDISKKNFKCSNRYSPGYCDWNVVEQHKLFSLLPDNFCNIKLTKSALMIPIKSVSGIIGFGSSMKKAEYTCKICTMENCYMRQREE